MISTTLLASALRVSTTEAEGAYVAALEAAAVAHVERQTNRYFGGAGEVTQFACGLGTRELWLDEAPDTGQTIGVVEHVTPGDSGTTITAGDDSGFVVRGSKLIRKGGSVWHRGYEYAVTYTRGYAADSEPADIRKAVLDLVTHWYERRVPLPKVGENLAFPVPHHVAAILRGWRRPPAGSA